MKDPIFKWYPETGMAVCILTDHNSKFIGEAFCHDDDEDMKNEKTGCQIALWRAEIEYYTYLRDYELKPSLSALNHLASTITVSKKFNPKSYEMKRLWKEIQNTKNDLDVVNQLLIEKKQMVKEYIEEKEKFYQRIRKNRQQDKKD